MPPLTTLAEHFTIVMMIEVEKAVGFEMQPYDETKVMHRSLLAAATKAARTKTDDRAKAPNSHVFVGEDLVFLPWFFTGSMGLLFVVSTNRLIILGSGFSLNDYLWAYHRGICVDAQDDAGRHNTFRISAISSKSETLRMLRKLFSNRFVREEIDPTFAELPLCVGDVDLGNAIHLLRRAEADEYFTFEIS